MADPQTAALALAPGVRVPLTSHLHGNGGKQLFTGMETFAYQYKLGLVSGRVAVEVHAEGPVSIPIASKDEDILHGSLVGYPPKKFLIFNISWK